MSPSHFPHRHFVPHIVVVVAFPTSSCWSPPTAPSVVVVWLSTSLSWWWAWLCRCHVALHFVSRWWPSVMVLLTNVSPPPPPYRSPLLLLLVPLFFLPSFPFSSVSLPLLRVVFLLLLVSPLLCVISSYFLCIISPLLVIFISPLRLLTDSLLLPVDSLLLLLVDSLLLLVDSPFPVVFVSLPASLSFLSSSSLFFHSPLFIPPHLSPSPVPSSNEHEPAHIPLEGEERVRLGSELVCLLVALVIGPTSLRREEGPISSS